jgi:hypothetical protein
MKRHPMMAAALGIALAAQPISQARAAVYAEPAVAAGQAPLVERTQNGQGAHGAWHRGPGPGQHAYPGWRGGPGWRGASPWRGPPGWAGRPYWYGRPWVARPYYGTIIAGVALGTLITVAAVGYVPPRPAPNLCWYWADPYANRGYWDYCG